MLIFQELIKRKATGGGYIYVPATIQNRFGREPEEVTVILLDKDEIVDADKLKELIEKQKVFVEKEKEYQKLKAELLGDDFEFENEIR